VAAVGEVDPSSKSIMVMTSGVDAGARARRDDDNDFNATCWRRRSRSLIDSEWVVLFVVPLLAVASTWLLAGAAVCLVVELWPRMREMARSV